MRAIYGYTDELNDLPENFTDDNDRNETEVRGISQEFDLIKASLNEVDESTDDLCDLILRGTATAEDRQKCADALKELIDNAQALLKNVEPMEIKKAS